MQAFKTQTAPCRGAKQWFRDKGPRSLVNLRWEISLGIARVSLSLGWLRNVVVWYGKLTFFPKRALLRRIFIRCFEGDNVRAKLVPYAGPGRSQNGAISSGVIFDLPYLPARTSSKNATTLLPPFKEEPEWPPKLNSQILRRYETTASECVFGTRRVMPGRSLRRKGGTPITILTTLLLLFLSTFSSDCSATPTFPPPPPAAFIRIG